MPSSKGYIKIKYPRKCSFCDYISNNPSMWHYHNKTHEVILEGQLCNFGCGQSAKFRNTNGTYSCCKKSQLCPQYKLELSKRVKEQWARQESNERKKKTRETFLKYCSGIPKVIEKRKKTLAKKFNYLNEEVSKDFCRYGRRCRVLAQRWAKEQGYELGQQTWHVDHKLSIWQGFQSKIPPSIICHPANLQILSMNENTSKGYQSSITVIELLKMIGIKDYEPYDTTMKSPNRSRTDEQKKRMSDGAKNRHREICKYCGKENDTSDIKSHHNEKCKLSPNYVKRIPTEKQIAQYKKPISEETRKRMSEVRKGKNKGKTYEELYGPEKAKFLKEQKSRKMKETRQNKKW